MSKKKICFIINPLSGVKKRIDLEGLILKKFPKANIEYTKKSGDAFLFAKKAVKKKYDIIAAVGGDGTVNEAGRALINTEATLAIVPAGSGNGFSRHLKISQKLDLAIENILSAKQKQIDVLKVGKNYFLGMAGLGFDAHIAQKFSLSKKRGFWSYVKIVFKEYFRYSSRFYKISIGSQNFIKKAFLISFANSSQYGNNIKIAPFAKEDDGKYQLVILKPFPFFYGFEIAYHLFRGTIHKSKYYESYECTKSLNIKNAKFIHIDGEPISIKKNIKINLLPKALNVLVP